VDGYLAVRPENARYLTGFALRDGEEKVAGTSGHVLVTLERVVLFVDPRYEEQARREAPESELVQAYHDLPARWPAVVAADRLRRVAVDQAASWGLVRALAAAAPAVELIPAPPWVEELRSQKEPAEVERIAAAAAVVDDALGRWLHEVASGMTEVELAQRLEWRIRSEGANGLAFDVTVLAGPDAALPHGHPGERPVARGDVLLVDVGAQVDGYRSDMTRTFFVGPPSGEAMDLYRLVLRAQEAALEGLAAAAAAGAHPTGQEVDGWARQVIAGAGYGEAFVHGLGHGIGLATHEAPAVSFRAPPEPLPGPTVFSVEPGVYLPGRLGIRIEDLVLFDPDHRRVELLTRFPREPLVVEP
jgi:Xaa-Pro aminopeptidase